MASCLHYKLYYILYLYIRVIKLYTIYTNYLNSNIMLTLKDLIIQNSTNSKTYI